MFTPGDPRIDEILSLAALAAGEGLLDRQRPRWRELVTVLLGGIREAAGAKAQPPRQNLRAGMELEVDVLEPDELAGLTTSSVGSGGLAIRIPKPIPAGTQIALSIKLNQRKVPLLAKGLVVWSGEGQVGVAFVNVYQHDRELLEGLAVQALLGPDKPFA